MKITVRRNFLCTVIFSLNIFIVKLYFKRKMQVKGKKFYKMIENLPLTVY